MTAALPSLSHAGKVSLVTGVGSGIGRAAALAFAQAGARVVVSDVDEPGCVETVRQIVAMGGEARLVPCDVTQKEDWDRVLAVNLTGVWFCLKYELLAMAAAGGGAIVNTASVAGLFGMEAPGPAYVAGQHGVIGLSRKAVREYATAGIRVNAACPGWTRTPLIAKSLADPEVEAERAARAPMGRLGTPEEVAAAAVA